jgi:translation initiation factor IF-2
MIPTHFGYLTENHLDSVLKNPQTTYLISHEKMRQFIFAIREDRRDRFDSYNEEDFFRLNTDNSVQSVYKNKEFEIWIIQPYKAA